jgi:arylsulfatase A-like enzyme
LRLIVPLFLTWLLGSTFGAGKLLAADRPNILFIICDDLNNTVEGMGGQRQAHAPNIDRLMRSGNGEEELYDHRTDPHEWHNLAAKPEQAKVKVELREELRKLTGH